MTITPSKQTRKPRLRAAMAAMAWALLGSILIPTQALADPSWTGDPAATMQRFDFTTSVETVAPDVAANGFGIAAAVVEHFTPPGSGWQDPNDEFTAAGIGGGDGAWDLGPGGSIEITVPVSPTPPSGLSYDVEFYIEAVVYQGPVARPSLSITDQAIVGFNETATLLEEDAPGAYYLLTWTGVVPASSAEKLHYLVQAGGSAALVDSLEIHTRYTLNKTPTTVTLEGLTQIFDGNPKTVTAATDPLGLIVHITYDGSPTPPTNTGSYAVVATIDDPVYGGGASGLLQIANGSQTILFDPIPNQIATGTIPLEATGGASGNPVVFEVTSGPALIGPGNVLTFTGAGTVSVTATQAGSDNYLAATEVTRTFAVTKTPATINVTGLSPVYDGDSKPVITSTFPEGLNVVVTYDGSPVAPVGAGSYVVVATIDDAIYEGTTVKALTVAKAVQVINFSQVGDQLTTATVNLTATGGGSDIPVTFVVTTGQSTLGAGNVLSFPAAGAVSVTASQEGDANHFPAADVTRTFNVTKASGTVVLGDLVQTYDGTPKAATATTTPSGLTVNFTYNGSATTPTQTGSYGVVATIVDPIYGGSASGSFVIEKSPQTIDFPPIAEQLTTATVTLEATGGASGNAVTFAVTSGQAVLGDGGDTLTFTASGSVTITASQAGTGNYLAATPVAQTFTVMKAPATVLLASLSHSYDGTPKAAEATTTPDGLTVSLAYDGASEVPVAAGAYAVVATIIDDVYVGSASGTLTIGETTQIIDFAVIADQVATASLNLAASGGAPGNPVTFAVTDGQAILGEGNVLTFTGAGAVSITASQAAVPNYLAATDVTRTFTVTKDVATVMLSDLTATYDGNVKAASAATTPADLAVTFTYEGLPSPPSDAGSYTVVGTIDDAIYGGSATGTLVIAKAAQVIEFPAIPDQLVSSAVNLTATGGGSDNPVSFAVTAGPGDIAGGTVLTFTTAGTVSVTASQAEGPNHLAAADVTRTFEVEFSGYDAWRATEYPGETDPLIIGVSARPFGQALANGYRYYLGNAAYDPAVLISMGEEGGAWLFSHLRVEPTPEDALAVYEWSTDLLTWHGDGQSAGGLTVDFEVTAGTLRPDERVPVEVRAVPSGSAPDRLFVRLKLVVPLTLP